MKKGKILLLVLVCLVTFFLVYSSHLNNPFPIHIDEWHHITEALKLKNGEYTLTSGSLRFGFQLILAGLSFVLNLTLAYQFFPAIWAVITSLILFWTVYKKTSSYKIGLLSMVFFASIKSNVNLGGLWFFTPLTFSIPFIFLFIFFFTEGIEKNSKKNLLLSLLFIIILLFVHPISFLFSIPFLLVYTLINLKNIHNKKTFLYFLLIPVLGLIFYKAISGFSFLESIKSVILSLQFRYGWGVLELNNSPLEVYSLAGYILAVLGVLFLIKKDFKKYLAYILWPALVGLSILFFKIFSVSYLSPYQRNMYYLAISLPLLSAFGLNFLLSIFNHFRNKKAEKVLKLIFILAILLLVFAGYFSMNENVKLYKVLDKEDYSALKYLSNYPQSVIMAPLDLASAIPVITKLTPVASLYFYGNSQEVNNFYLSDNCTSKNRILERFGAKYVFSREKINCNWNLIYSKNSFVYQVK